MSQHTSPALMRKRFFSMWQLYVLLLPTLVYIAIFCYGPMYGILMAFKDYKMAKGIWGSPWVGLKHFTRFFNMPRSGEIIRNTFALAIYQLLASFPLPIVLALSMNALNGQRFKRVVQTVTYAPHFISTVVVVGMLSVFLSPSTGVVNSIIKALGGSPVFFLGRADLFPSLYVWSGVWQSMGWNSIIYLAALSGVDPGLHEAAIVDGATKFQRVMRIDFFMILPTITTLAILNAGKILTIGFEKVYLMQNSLNTSSSEVISTYVYKRGMVNGEFSFSTAVGLFNSVVNLAMLVIVNTISRRVSETSLW